MSGPRNTIPPLLQYLYQITLHMMARSLRDRPVRGLEQFPELQKYMTTGVSLMKLMKKGKKMIKLTLKETQGTTNKEYQLKADHIQFYYVSTTGR